MRHVRSSCVALARAGFCVATVLAPTAALAQQPAEAADASPWAMSQQNRAGAEIDFWPAKQTAGFGATSFEASWYALGFDAVGQFRLVPHVFLDVDLPFGYGHYTITETVAGQERSQTLDHFVLGDITVGAHYAQDITRDVAFFVGGTVSVPTMLAGQPDTNDLSDEETYLSAALLGSTRALYDLHRWAPEYVTIRARGGIEWRILPILFFRADLAPAVYIPMHSCATAPNATGTCTGGENKVEFFTDQGNEIEARANMGVGGGLRLQEAFFWSKYNSCPAGSPDCPGGDIIQTAIEPFFSYEPPGAGLYARFGALVALDKQAGFGFDHGKVASFRGGIGGKW